MKHYYIAESLIGESDIQLSEHENILNAESELRKLVSNSHNYSISIDYSRN